MKNRIKNILWVRTDSIGDAVLSSSMLPYVHQVFAGAQITVVCQAHIAPLYEACPFVDRIIIVPSEHKWQSRAQYEAVIKNIQELHPDILLNSTFATHGLADIPGLEFIPKRVAFRNVRWASYTDIIPTSNRQKPELERHCDFLRGLGADVSSLKPQVWITDEDEQFAEKTFKKYDLRPERTVALFAGARTEHKFYSHYGEALRGICGEAGYNVIALGAAKDYKLNQQNLESIGMDGTNLSGKVSLRQAAAILKRCRLAVGTDTALAHISCAVETPNVILLGGAHFGRFMPYSPLTSVVCLPLECFGCDWKCRYDKVYCVWNIATQVVSQAVRQTLTASSQKPRVFVQGPSLWNPNPSEPDWKRFDEFINSLGVEIIQLETEATAINQTHGAQTEIDVSIILCTKDRAALLDPMLTSLNDAIGEVRCEVIVVEGGSSDNTLDVLHAHGIKKVYDETQCLGPGRHTWPQLYNFGFSKARGKWAMYASDDILFGTGCISRAVELLNAQKDEVAGGIFFFKNTHTGPDWDKFGIDFTFGPKLLMNYGLVRLDHFRMVGGLDEAYRFYCADGDLCFKLYKSGKQLIPLPGCFVVHDNVLDVAKQANADASETDIQLYIKRWKHFVSPQRPFPRRLLWQDDLAEEFNLPVSLPKIDSAIEHFWHGLACIQYNMFVRAKVKFLQAVQSACDHWLVLWHLAKAAFESEDEPLATKATHAVLQLVPDFQQAKDLLTRLDSKPQQVHKSSNTRIENDGDTSTVSDDVLKSMKIYNDSPVFDDVGFDNSDCRTNGEFALIRRLLKTGDLVFDIGANTGEWSRQVLSTVENVCLYTFEPVPDTFAVLKNNLGPSGAHLHNIAISDNNGSKTFYHYNQNSKLARMSSFYRRSRTVEQNLDMQPLPISVRAETLDAFCREHSIPHIDFVKIDTEGAELDVLRGGAGLLRAHRIKMLQFEYGGTYPDAGITLQQVCRLLSSHGYVILRILPDGLVHMANWRDSLENNRYSNYLAVSSKVAGNYTVMQNLPPQKTYPDIDLKAVPEAPALLAVTPQTDVLAQLTSAGLWSEGRPLRLHLGCGKWHFDGYINIDYPPENHNVVTNLGADLYADITDLNFPPQTVDEIRLHHVFEHFDRATALGLLIKWHEWLKVGGKLCIETPDLIGSAKTLLSNASLKTKMGVVRHLAGDQADKWAFHTDHWFAERFEHTLSQLGFGPAQTRTSSWSKEPYLSNVHVQAAKQLHLAREQLLAACDELLLDSLVDDVSNELAKHKIWMHQIRTFLDETAPSRSKAEHPLDEAGARDLKYTAPNDVATEIVGLIFSKDRPMQLAAAIESFALHCLDNANIKLHVLYKASNELYCTQYDTLKNEFTDVTFIEETDFKAQTLAVISGYEHVLFLVDDNLFVTDFGLADILALLKQNHNALAFSLRLGRNTTYSYARDTQVNLPPFWYIGKKVLKYDWTRGQIHFAYPLEVSSSIYRTADIVPLLEKLDFDNPNMLEGLMAANAQVYAKPRVALLCYEQSVTFCNPLNIVQTISNNRAGSLSRYSADSLAKMFEQGLRIDVQRYAGFVPNSPHQEVELKFVKSGSDSRSDGLLVSVEMIAYNAEKFIAKALDSILAQTYKNFELLVIDDGSTDRTKEIISSYSDSRIRYIHKPHKNRWSGTNIAIAQAKGQYIITVDSDDFIAPDYIEKMVACAQRHPEIDYFYPPCLTITDAAGNPTGGRWDYLDFSDNTILPNFLFEHAYSPIPHPGSMKRKSLYQRVAGYEEVQNAADFVFLCRNSLKIRFKCVGDHSTYFYRLLPTSLSHKFKARNQITADILNEMVSIYPPEVICPHIGHITEPALRGQQYYKYLMETFYKHVHGHMVKFGEYFRRYGDYYKQQLLNCAPAVNTAASAVAASAKSPDIQTLFKRGIEQLKADQPAGALACFDEIYHSGGVVADLQYARAIAFARLGRIDEARKACLAQLTLQTDHKPANELLEQISQCVKVTN